PEGSRSGFGALHLGVYEPDGSLRYAGKVGTGFNQESLSALRERLEGLVQKNPPFVDPPAGAEARRSHWVKPELVAEVNFTEWTKDGTLRHPSFLGLREDKKATDVVRERPIAPSDALENSDPAKPQNRPTPAESARKTSTRRSRKVPAPGASDPAD